MCHRRASCEHCKGTEASLGTSKTPEGDKLESRSNCKKRVSPAKEENAGCSRGKEEFCTQALGAPLLLNPWPGDFDHKNDFLSP